MKQNILWIDDTNIRKPSGRRRDNSLGDELPIFNSIYKQQVKYINNLYEAIKYILEYKGVYDLIILDIDMTEKKIHVDINDVIWKKFFEYVFVDYKIEKNEQNPNENIVIENGNKSYSANEYLNKYAGFFLTILTVTLGFPLDRIIIFTAYGGENDNLTKKWEQKFHNASFHIPQIIDKGSGWKSEEHIELNKNINFRYEDTYYKIRMYIFNMYNFVMKNLCQNNSMYNYCLAKKASKFTKENIFDEYEKLLFFFPQTKPGDSKLYNYALNQFINPFDMDYEFKKKAKYECRIYRILKICRNWIAHHLFDKIISAEFFLFIFSLTSIMYLEKEDNDSFQTDIDELEKIVNVIDKEQEMSNDIDEYFTILERKYTIPENELCEKNGLKKEGIELQFAIIEWIGNHYKVKEEYIYAIYLSCCKQNHNNSYLKIFEILKSFAIHEMN